VLKGVERHEPIAGRHRLPPTITRVPLVLKANV
jgi:hypothetical protein